MLEGVNGMGGKGAGRKWQRETPQRWLLYCMLVKALTLQHISCGSVASRFQEQPTPG